MGPRQCGKTTVARQIAASRRSTWFDLEDPEVALRQEAAKQVLAPLRGLVVIDECQRQPALFPLLRVLADRRPRPARFLILGSASPDLVRGVSETLAGRVARLEMGGFVLSEVDTRRRDDLWLRGGLPPSFLARTDADSFAWRADFVTTFLERDVPQLGIRVPAPALRRFWTMLAHLHGQVWNAAELARALGTGEAAARHHLDILVGAFLVRVLPPWFENLGKRLVKAAKVYVRDSGLLHYLLGARRRLDLYSHPKLGASWEGFALEQVVRRLDAERDAYFYATHGGAELDLLIVRGRRRLGFEFKHADLPDVTRSMHVALADLRLEHLFVVHPGERSHGLRERVSALALRDLDTVRREWKLG
ncbi:MAG: ATP-binding protein [Deltaproteobacteria bacterium]|nr:ATP-binding protein [Deltaproteobacteria bacterium]